MLPDGVMITRREFLATSASSLLSLNLLGCSGGSPPLRGVSFSAADYQALPILGLATSLPEEHDYEATVEGRIPAQLRGTLYRNGPGLFERNGLRKRCLLDGDGMVQAFRIDDGRVRFQNRFVRTQKYLEESAAGRFLNATWSTQAPGGFWTNLGRTSFKNQAGVSVVVREGRLFAFDEFHPPYELDPDTLETIGESWLGVKEGSTVFSAHSKLDPLNGDWLFYGLEYGPETRLHLTVLGQDGLLKKHQAIPLPRTAYIHDFFVSDRHFIFNLPPMEIRPLPFLFGQKSMTDSMRWAPEKGNLLLVVPRDENRAPVQMFTEAAWMWHALNAYEEGGQIIADFVGYRNPDHFIGKDPALFAVMEGRQGDYRFPGEIRRYVIDPARQRVAQETMDGGNYEFPYVNPRLSCHRHRFGYFISIVRGEAFFTSVVRFDTHTGKSEGYDFGPGIYCSEPVFAQEPGFAYLGGGAQEPGWLMTEVYDSHKHKSSLAIFQAEALGNGPVATVHLRHHVPLGFHGFWQGA